MTRLLCFQLHGAQSEEQQQQDQPQQQSREAGSAGSGPQGSSAPLALDSPASDTGMNNSNAEEALVQPHLPASPFASHCRTPEPVQDSAALAAGAPAAAAPSAPAQDGPQTATRGSPLEVPRAAAEANQEGAATEGERVGPAVAGESAYPAEADQPGPYPPSGDESGCPAATASAASGRSSSCSSSGAGHCADPPTAEDRKTEPEAAALARQEAAGKLQTAVPAAAPSPWLQQQQQPALSAHCIFPPGGRRPTKGSTC